MGHWSALEIYLCYFLPFANPHCVCLQCGDTDDIISLIAYILFLFRLVVVLLYNPVKVLGSVLD
jgi:hypothetical protein